MIRLLTLATLATSLSAFAATDDSKRNETVTVASASQENSCASQEGKKHRKEKKTQPAESEQDKEFDRVLMSIYG